jgi:hypothetical protein
LRRYIDAHDVLIDEWVSGTTIAAVVPYRSGPPWGYELVKVAGGVQPPKPLRSSAKGSGFDVQSCYSELQRPISLHAFTSGTITVVGEFRCDLGSDGDEVDEDANKPPRPVIEHFPAGKYQSLLVDLPLDEVLTTLSPKPNSLWILGTVGGDDSQKKKPKQTLFHFDGAKVSAVEADVDGARALTFGPPTGEEETSEAGPQPLWMLDENWLRPTMGTGDRIRLPRDCQGTSAWFEGEHAWVVCEKGLFTTDPSVTPFSVPRGHQHCEDLMPEPEYAVRGLFQRSSEGGSCGRSKERAGPKGSKVAPSTRPGNLDWEF